VPPQLRVEQAESVPLHEGAGATTGLSGDHDRSSAFITISGGRIESDSLNPRTHPGRADCRTTSRPQSRRLGRARVLHVPGADGNDNAGDRNHLVLAKPNVIMNDTRLRRLGVAGSDAAGRKNPHNHAQTAWNLKRSLRNAAAGVRLIQAEGLDSESAADVAASLAGALVELHRLQRRLDRRIRRD
jgi:hypothetical protein